MATLSNRQIAARLVISPQTVKNDWSNEIFPVARLLAKRYSLSWSENSTKRTRAVLIALYCNLIELEEISRFQRRQGGV